jgi:hypothetical protein
MRTEAPASPSRQVRRELGGQQSDHRRAVTGQSLHNRPADPPRATRDQRLLAREHTHTKLLGHDHSTPRPATSPPTAPRISYSDPLGPGLLAIGEGRLLAQHAPGRPDARIRPTKRLQLRRLSLVARHQLQRCVSDRDDIGDSPTGKARRVAGHWQRDQDRREGS